ncbi:hypothetical protein ABKA04_002491 [Annulohypoxylon sp. FPYF3050]
MAEYRFNDQVLPLNFDSNRNVTFIQTTHPHAGRSQVRVAGQVNVRRLDNGGSPRIVLEIATNDRGLLLDVISDEEAQAMKISIPKNFPPADPRKWPCVELRATVWVPQDADIGVLDLDVVHLDILLLNDLSLHVADYTKLLSTTGSIISSAPEPNTYNSSVFMSEVLDFTFVPAKESYLFDSRVIEVRTTTGEIHGNWPLYDMLGLHTTSGNIRVSITPQPELASDPKSAVLSITSTSGVIHAVEPTHEVEKMPLRDYLVDLRTTSGNIGGAVAFGAGATFRSTASSFALELLPIMHVLNQSPEQPAQLETGTTSGTTAINILEPVFYNADQNGTIVVAGKQLDCLQALHKSTSGYFELRYPEAWVGDLWGQTTSGHLSVRGRGVQTVYSGRWPMKVQARKGDGAPGSVTEVKAMSGDLDAVIGSE